MEDKIVKLRVVEKTITTKEPLPERLYRAILDYRNKWHSLPDGLLVGPNEWMELVTYHRTKQRFYELDGQTSFYGVPLYRTTRPGIDVMPGEGIVPYLAIGSVKERS